MYRKIFQKHEPKIIENIIQRKADVSLKVIKAREIPLRVEFIGIKYFGKSFQRKYPPHTYIYIYIYIQQIMCRRTAQYLLNYLT